MKKTGSRRASGHEAGLSSAVLEAPEESYALETGMSSPEARASWKGSGPAPAGALQRGYDGDDHDGPETRRGGREEAEYVPRRGQTGVRVRGLRQSVAGRIVLGVVALGVLVVAAAGVSAVRQSMLHNPRFVMGTSDDIQIIGAQHLTRDQVLSVFGADLERNIFRVPLEQRRKSVEELPWVAHATVMRLLPNTLRVQIAERTPAAFVRQGTQIGLVDAGGVLLNMPPDTAGDPLYSFPVLTGLSSDEPLKARAEKMQVYGQFMAELESAHEHLTDSVSEVDMSDPEDVKALIASGGSDILVHFGNEDFLKRYREFEEHLPAWKQAYPRLASADMRYEGQIVLEMQKGEAPEAGGGDAMAAAPSEDAAPAPVVVAKLKSAEVKSAEVAGRVAKLKPATGATSARPPAVKAKTSAAKAKPSAAKAGVRAKTWVAKKASGDSAANQRVFAALAAAHRAELAKAAAARSARAKGTRRSGASR